MASITIGQIATAVTATQQLVQQCQQLMVFLNQVNAISANNWQTTQTIGGYPVTITIGPTDQANLLAQYQTLKSTLVTTFGTLP